MTLPVTLLVMLESPIFAFLGLGARKSNPMSCAAAQSVNDVVVQRRSVVVAATTAAALDGDDLDNSAGK